MEPSSVRDDLLVSSLRGAARSTLRVPGDKSISHRALLLGALTPGETIVSNLNTGGAVTVLVGALRELGHSLQLFPQGTVRILGRGPNEPPPRGFHLDFGSSSAAARLCLGALSGLGARGVIDGDASLRARPMDFVVEPLRAMGAEISYLLEPGRLPLELRGGELEDSEVSLRVGSAQAASAVLLAALTARRSVRARLLVRSRDHTERLLAHLGCAVHAEGNVYRFEGGTLQALPYVAVPGDPSLAAYVAAAHAARRGQTALRIADVGLNPTRLGFFECLRRMGAQVDYELVGNAFGEPVGNIVVTPPSAGLSPLRVEGPELVHSMIDELPLLAALCTLADGRSVIRDAAELAWKETNRLQTTAGMLEEFGANVQVEHDGLVIEGGGRLLPAIIDGRNDHRIAMSAAVLATTLPGKTRVLGGTCADTSFPAFAECMQDAGFDVRVPRRPSSVAREETCAP